jgi:3-hydroxyacyl-[acyl-carrier-protein] dehydratase
MENVLEKPSVEQILSLIPQQDPFRFVDELTQISEDGVTGSYTFKLDESFYKGHFPDMPVTPGVILTECMAQIGLVALGLYLIGGTEESTKNSKTLFTSSYVDFKKMVLPGDKVIVKSVKKYFRFKKLCCDVRMETPEGDLICSGELSGMFVSQ